MRIFGQMSRVITPYSSRGLDMYTRIYRIKIYWEPHAARPSVFGGGRMFAWSCYPVTLSMSHVRFIAGATLTRIPSRPVHKKKKLPATRLANSRYSGWWTPGSIYDIGECGNATVIRRNDPVTSSMMPNVVQYHQQRGESPVRNLSAG